jgi:hypothetical protein
MPTKLGIYLINCSDLPVEWFSIAKPTAAMSMDPNHSYWAEVKRVSPDTRIIGRHFKGYTERDWSADADPIADANAYVNAMRADVETMRDLYSGWMLYNEPNLQSHSDAQKFCQFSIHAADLLTAIGVRCGFGSFGEGSPQLEFWDDLWEALYHFRWLFLHEYDAPDMKRTSPWRCLRYRQVLQAMPSDLRRRIRIMVTETGIDGGVSGIDMPQVGWTGFGDIWHYLSAENGLQWYDSEINKDPEVEAAIIFAAKWDRGHGSYDVANATEIRDYIGRNPKPPIAPWPPENSVSYQFWADPTTINFGQSSTLHGTWTGVKEVWLGTEGLAGPTWSKLVTPSQTTTYTFRVVLTDGTTKTSTVTVTVNGGSGCPLGVIRGILHI